VVPDLSAVDVRCSSLVRKEEQSNTTGVGYSQSRSDYTRRSGGHHERKPINEDSFLPLIYVSTYPDIV
jgi:hypothetical protein